MPLWPRILSLWRNMFHGERVDLDLDEELRAHLDMLIEEKARSGMSREEARRAALIEFGGIQQTKEQVRASRTGFLLETVWQDLRYGARILAKSPGFTATAVVSLAVGIGATTAVFSIYETIFLRPLPYLDSDRLVGIRERRLDQPEPDSWESISVPTFLDWKKQSQSFEELTAAFWGDDVLLRGDRAESISYCHVSDGYLRMSGAKACRGRLLIAEDYAPGQIQRGVLSYGAWQRLFGSDPAVIGKTIITEGGDFHIVGVICPEYRDPLVATIDVWLGRNWASLDFHGQPFA